MSMLFVYTATILSDVNCTSEWVLQGERSDDATPHRTASTLTKCREACEFDPHCVAVDWKSDGQECDLNIHPDHAHRGGGKHAHYHLVSRCNITPGQCFDSNVVANINLLKLFETRYRVPQKVSLIISAITLSTANQLS